MIVSAEPDALNPIEPITGMELKKVKELVGDRVCLVGNIDCAHLLPHGTEEDVHDAVRQAIAECNPQNLVAMVQAVKQYGAYPIS